MSRSAHAKSTYELHRLPRCTKCKQQFQLVTAHYEMKNGDTFLAEEWECPKCGKTVPRNSLREDPQSEEDRGLSEWCKNEQRRQEKTRKKRPKR